MGHVFVVVLIDWARDITKYPGVAQLVEHTLWEREVMGSNPVTWTIISWYGGIADTRVLKTLDKMSCQCKSGYQYQYG